MTDLDQELDRGYAEGWRPVPGQKLIGKLAAVSESSPGEYGTYPILTIEPSDSDGNPTGEDLKAVHAFHSVLRREVLDAAPNIGDVIGIKYEGTVEGGNFGHYENYIVKVNRPEGTTVDWSRHDPDAGSETPPSVATAPTSEGSPTSAGSPTQGDDDIPF